MVGSGRNCPAVSRRGPEPDAGTPDRTAQNIAGGEATPYGRAPLSHLAGAHSSPEQQSPAAEPARMAATN